MQQVRPIDAATLEKVLSSAAFARSERMCRFLRLLVERANGENRERIKETEIGVLVFDREVGYDPKIDSIVRTEASRLRRKLNEYYLAEGANDLFRMQLPSGRYELEIVAQPPAERVTVAAPASKNPKPSRAWYWASGFAAVVLAAALIWRAELIPASIPAAVPLTFFPGVENQPAFSPDGKSIAFTWDGESQGSSPAIYAQRLDSQTPTRITHSEQREYRPVWSPDGKAIAFLRQATPNRLEVWKVSAEGRDEARIAELHVAAVTVPGLSWSPDGAWLASAEAPSDDDRLRLVLISPKTGEKQIFRNSPERASYLHPAFSADGRRLAYVKSPEVGVNDVFVADFPKGQQEQQVTFDHAPIYGIAWDPRGSALVVSSQRAGSRWSLWRMPLGGGKPRRLTDGSAEAIYPAVSPDGSALIFSRRMDDINIWRRSLASPDIRDIGKAWLESSGLDSSPQFSPDGQKVAFRSDRTGTNEIWIAEADGRSVRQLSHMGGPLTGSPRWSPDGKWLAYDSRASGDSDIWIIPASGGESRRLTLESSNEAVAGWSRDGRFVYYGSDQSGAWSVWRRPYAGGSAERVREKAFAPVEGNDGYLYYARGPNEKGLFRAPLSGGPEEAILPELHVGMWGSWALGQSGIYFVDMTETEHGMEAWAQLRMPTGTTRKLFRIEHPVRWDGVLSISPDEKWIAYARLDRTGSDLFSIRAWQ